MMSKFAQSSSQSTLPVDHKETGKPADIDRMSDRGGRSLSVDSLENASFSRSACSGSSNSVHSDENSDIVYEHHNSYEHTLPDSVDGSNKIHTGRESSESNEGTHSSGDSTQRRKSASDKTSDKTNVSLKRRNTTDAASNSTSYESSSTLTSNPSAKTPSTSVRHTKISMTRRQLARESNVDEYLTPLQKKEHMVVELRQELQSTRQAVSDLESQIVTDQEGREQKIKSAIEDRDHEIQSLRKEVEDLRTSMESVTSSHKAAEERANQLEQNLAQLKEESEQKEIRNQELFLRMYTKGQECAKIERELQLEEQDSDNPVGVGVTELMKKLELTQAQLDRWQTLRRQEIYEGVGAPGTDSEVRFRFMRDSLFHFLISVKDSDDHLRAMVRVAEFTDAQIVKIRKAVMTRRK